MRDNVKGAGMWPGPGFNVRLSFNIMPARYGLGTIWYCVVLSMSAYHSISTDGSVTSPPILCQLKVAITCYAMPIAYCLLLNPS